MTVKSKLSKKLKILHFLQNFFKNRRVFICVESQKIVDLALTSKLKDLEDAIQLYAAKERKIKYLVTRNIKDYKDSEVTAVTAEEYNKIWKGGRI